MEELKRTDPRYGRILTLINGFLNGDDEKPYFEVKNNYAEPEKIGEYVSALSNEAKLADKPYGYLVWGINDKERKLLGTTFDTQKTKKGNVELEAWLMQLTEPKTVSLEFFYFDLKGKRLATMIVGSASTCPTRFNGKELVRNGSHNKPLRDFPSKESSLWIKFASSAFESEVALSNLSVDDIFRHLDVNAFYHAADIPMPSDRSFVISDLCKQKILAKEEGESYAILNVGALLLARDFQDFPALLPKSIRVIQYATNTNTSAEGEQRFAKGYLLCLVDCEAYIRGLLPKKELFDSLRREEITLFPKRAIREALGNLIAHQDLSSVGIGPCVGVHPDYLDFANPGAFEGDVLRAMDALANPRNLILLNLLHYTNYCEGRGTGVDLMEEWMGIYQQPAPVITSSNGSTHLYLRHYNKLSDWNSSDILNTIYMRVCFNYLSQKETSNADIRERLGVSTKNTAIVSRALAKTVESGLIKIIDLEVGTKARKYVPFWA